MNTHKIKKQNLTLKYIKSDLPASMVVFFIALPLCLGIAVASGVSPFAGLITGIIGGILVGWFSNSNLSVSGPAAGLIAIILVAVSDIGFEALLLATVLAGIFQLILGFAKAGTIADYFPTSVIEGMLAAIGIIIIKKEFPHAIGYDKAHEGDFFSVETGAESGFWTETINAINYAHLGVILVTVVSILILLAFNKIAVLKKIKAIPGALIVVIAGISLNELFKTSGSSLIISQDHLVSLPIPATINDFFSQFKSPDFTSITNTKVWVVAATIAAVASLETLLCLEASDKLDPLKRYSSPNAELKAQGIGNVLSGLLGGIPMTSVIVRTSANITSGAVTKLSSIFHGVFLLLAVSLIPGFLNKIPMGCLAAILIMTGIRLANVKVFKHMWRAGKYQFLPFIITVVAVVLTDLLKGVGIGLATSIFFILNGNMRLAYFFKEEKHHEGETIHIDLAQEVSFLNKAAIKQTLAHLPQDTKLVINAADTVYIDFDVLELIKDFINVGSRDKNITVTLKNFKEEYKMEDSSHVHSDI